LIKQANILVNYSWSSWKTKDVQAVASSQWWAIQTLQSRFFGRSEGFESAYFIVTTMTSSSLAHVEPSIAGWELAPVLNPVVSWAKRHSAVRWTRTATMKPKKYCLFLVASLRLRPYIKRKAIFAERMVYLALSPNDFCGFRGKPSVWFQTRFRWAIAAYGLG
jgi:hypothetical protein